MRGLKRMSSKTKLKQLFWFCCKVAIALGIVLWLVRDPREIFQCFRTFRYEWLIPALGIYFAHMVICFWRWRRLLRILGMNLSAFETFSLTMQGYFFSLAPGGTIGGDVVKMGVLARRTPAGSKVEGAFSILMDRIVGMIALFALALALLWPATPLLLNISVPEVPLSPGMHWLFILGLGGLCVAGLAASCVIFFHRLIEKLPLCGSLMHWGDRVTDGMVSRMTAATDCYVRSWRELISLTIVSVFGVHLMTVAAYGCLMAGLNVPGFSVFDLVVAVTIGNIIGLVPLFPGGVGGRDAATVTILAAGGVAAADAKTAQLLYTAILLLFNLFGGLFFVFDPGRSAKTAAAGSMGDAAESGNGTHDE